MIGMILWSRLPPLQRERDLAPQEHCKYLIRLGQLDQSPSPSYASHGFAEPIAERVANAEERRRHGRYSDFPMSRSAMKALCPTIAGGMMMMMMQMYFSSKLPVTILFSNWVASVRCPYGSTRVCENLLRPATSRRILRRMSGHS